MGGEKGQKDEETKGTERKEGRIERRSMKEGRKEGNMEREGS